MVAHSRIDNGLCFLGKGSDGMPQVHLTAKEIHLIVQAIRIAKETGELIDPPAIRNVDIEQLRTKLQNVKDI